MPGHKSPLTTSSKSDNGDVYMPAPPLVFSDTSYTLGDLLKEHTLPRVIKCDRESSAPWLELTSNLDIYQPLLAFTNRSVVKVSAHSLQFDPDVGDFLTVGNGILIPDDYQGWFAVLGAPNEVTSQSLTIPHYTSISNLATSACSQFLVGGKDYVTAIRFQKDESSQQTNFRAYPIYPGTILNRKGLYQESSVATTKSGKKKMSAPRRYLKCCDQQDRQLFIDVQQRGLFYVISKDNRPVVPSVLQMGDILKRFHLPVIVKLLYGRVPTTPCAFTQVLLLTDSAMDHTIVASTLLCYHNINLEIPLEIDLKYHAAYNTEALLTSKAYMNALKVCEDKMPSYIKDMKVVFGRPQVPQNDVSSCNIKSKKHRVRHEKTATKPKDKFIPRSTKEKPIASECLSSQSTAIIPDMETGSVDEATHSNLPQRPVSIISMTSYLSCMTQHVTISDDSFILAEQPHSKSSKTPNISSPTNKNIYARSEMALITTYEPPNSDKNNDIIPIIQSSPINKAVPIIQSPPINKDVRIIQSPFLSLAQLPDHPKQAVRSNHLLVQPIIIKDNETSSCTISNDLLSSEIDLSSQSCNANTTTSQDNSYIYLTSWNDEKKPSTITIPSKSGQPVIPERMPLTDPKCFDYLQMLPKSLGETSPKPCGQNMTRGALKSNVKSPDLKSSGGINHENSFSSGNGSDCSLSDPLKSYESPDSWRLEPVVIHKDGERLNPYVDSDDHQHIENIMKKLKLQANMNGGSNDQIIASTFVKNNSMFDYVEPMDVVYPEDVRQTNNEYSDTTTTSVHYYSSPLCNDYVVDKTSIDQMYEDEHVYAKHADENVCDKSVEREINSAPQLPPRHKTVCGQTPVKLPNVCAKSISSFPVGQINKQMLVTELRNAGIKPSVEIAFNSLQWVDITYLLSRDDDFDDTLVHLLPKIGKIDLQKLAICLRGMKIRPK